MAPSFPTILKLLCIFLFNTHLVAINFSLFFRVLKKLPIPVPTCFSTFVGGSELDFLNSILAQVCVSFKLLFSIVMGAIVSLENKTQSLLYYSQNSKVGSFLHS